jgi:MYXO-CTERM domain-containing protein
MNFKNTLVSTALIGLCSLSAQAATWSKTATNSGSTCNAVNAVSCTIANTEANGSNATVTGWANTGSGGAWAAATLTNQGGSGFGVNNGNSADVGEGGSPEHALDNDGFVDAVRFQFAQSTTLSAVRTGWMTTDADFTVLAWTGAGAVNMGSLNNVANTRSMAGWTVVGNYATSAAGTTNFTTSVSSSFWLITAYNSAFGTGSNLNNGNDFFKLLSVSGHTNTSTNNRVSEPGALALAGLGLMGAAVVRRRRKQA